MNNNVSDKPKEALWLPKNLLLISLLAAVTLGSLAEVSFAVAAGSEPPALIFSDDFSTDQGWTDESGGFIYRDPSNEWLVWQVRRDVTRRYYIPINARTNYLQLNFRFNVTSHGGNGDVFIGFIEDLDGPDPGWPIDASGLVVHPSTFGGATVVRVFSKYSDGTGEFFDHASAPNFGSLNVWRKASFTLNDSDWTLSVSTDDGALLGTQSGTLSGTHSAYRYLMIFFDRTGGWEWQNGYFDDIEVWGFPIVQPVLIDIKPGSEPNCFNNDGHGIIPVAILTTNSFDASTVDPLSLTLDGASARVKGKSGNAGSLEDVDYDGDLDLVVQIEDLDGTYQEGDTIATLAGTTYDGAAIEGTDSVCIVP